MLRFYLDLFVSSTSNIVNIVPLLKSIYFLKTFSNFNFECTLNDSTIKIQFTAAFCILSKISYYTL